MDPGSFGGVGEDFVVGAVDEVGVDDAGAHIAVVHAAILRKRLCRCGVKFDGDLERRGIARELVGAGLGGIEQRCRADGEATGEDAWRASPSIQFEGAR